MLQPAAGSIMQVKICLCLHGTVSINNILLSLHVKERKLLRNSLIACFEGTGKVIGNRHVLSNNYTKIILH